MKEIKAIIQPFMLPMSSTPFTRSKDSLAPRPRRSAASARAISSLRGTRAGEARGHRAGPARRPGGGGDPAARAHGESGDGHVFVIPVERVLKIRTGEESQEA